MYLYLGEDTIIHARDVIGIFDLDNTSTSHLTRKYLAIAQNKDRVVAVSTELPKSFVVCANPKSKDKITVYLSQISPATLLKRAESPIMGVEAEITTEMDFKTSI